MSAGTLRSRRRREGRAGGYTSAGRIGRVVVRCSARRRLDWKPPPGTICLAAGKDALGTGPGRPVPGRGDAREGEHAVRKLRGHDLDPARREAPGPWRIGGRDDAGIHVLDANGERVATIWKTPSRSVAALEAIQALVVWIGDEVLGTRLCANPDCRRPFDAPSRKQKHCSSTCGVATQPHVIEARKRDEHAFELRWQGLTWREAAERSGLRDAQRARQGARKHARRKGLTLPA